MDPLGRPKTRGLLEQFQHLYRIPREGEPRRLLGDLARSFMLASVKYAGQKIHLGDAYMPT